MSARVVKMPSVDEVNAQLDAEVALADALAAQRPDVCEHGSLQRSCEVCEWRDRALTAEARLAAAEAVLKEIAGDGCGCTEIHDNVSTTCRTRHPDDKSAWCWCCIAADWLEGR